MATPPNRPAVAVEPGCWRREALVSAVEAGGGRVTPVAEATALVWAEPAAPELLPGRLHDAISWVQLPYAGIEPFLGMLDEKRTWTCGKGVYARPVAELALTLALAGLRGLDTYARTSRWEAPEGRELAGSRVVIVGGGGIARHLLDLLAPWRCDCTVVRLHPEPVAGASRVLPTGGLHDALRTADLVVLAAAATPATTGIIAERELDLMADHAWLVNVARGSLLVTDDLVAALHAGTIGGAGLDVTDPEPLPEGHPLWAAPNCLITPHVGNTPEMGLRLLAGRVTENVRRCAAGEPLLGPVDVTLGY